MLARAKWIVPTRVQVRLLGRLLKLLSYLSSSRGLIRGRELHTWCRGPCSSSTSNFLDVRPVEGL